MQTRNTAVFGPYKNDSGWRLMVGTSTGARNSVQCKTEEEAEELKLALQQEIEKQNTMKVAQALAAYREHLTGEENKPQSIATSLARLADFFTDAGSAVITLTPERCRELYADLVRRPAPRTGKPLSVDTQRNALSEAKTFLSFCVTQRWLPENPLLGVKGVGRRRHGKAQLRVNEATRFATKALELASMGQHGAVAVLVALLLGFRASEIVARRVRDLDDGGKCLVIDSGKTAAAARRVAVPDILQPYLVAMAAGKHPSDLLFGQHTRAWVRQWVHKVCDQAGLPRVTAHALRGMCSTLAVDSGIVTHAVAALLGHTSPSMTERSYVQPGTKVGRGQRELVRRLPPGLPREEMH